MSPKDSMISSYLGSQLFHRLREDAGWKTGWGGRRMTLVLDMLNMGGLWDPKVGMSCRQLEM